MDDYDFRALIIDVHGEAKKGVCWASYPNTYDAVIRKSTVAAQ